MPPAQRGKYSLDIQNAVLHATEHAELNVVNHLLGTSINPRTLKRWNNNIVTFGTPSIPRSEYKRLGRPKIVGSDQALLIVAIIRAQPDLYLDEIQLEFFYRTGVMLSVETLRREIVSVLHLTVKKARRLHINRDPLKAAAYLNRIGEVPIAALVFGDESSINMRKTGERPNARAPRGERAERFIQACGGKNFSLLLFVSIHGVVAAMVCEGSVTRDRYVRFLEKQLVSSPCSFAPPRHHF